MTQWVGGQVKVAKNTPTCGAPPWKPPTENKKFLFSISTTRLAESVEGLNSSLAQSPGELQNCKLCMKRGFRVT